MKKPNNFFAKKYISSLVIAAFLILSVLTAYNIKTGNESPESANTEVKETAEENVQETIGDNDDVISSNERPSVSRDEEDDEETQSEKEIEDSDTSKEEEEKYSYDGKNDLTWPLIGNIILPYSMDTTVYYTTLDQ